MLPSMPILFSNSQDAFGNRAEPSTSYFHQGLFQKPPETLAPPPAKVVEEPVKEVVTKETKAKSGAKKKEQNKPPPKPKENSLETALVRSYYTKVQSKFSSNLNVPANKFIQFQSILKSFNPSKETPVDLYKKIEQLFGEAHSEFVEDFLLFLKPGQAAEVGRFMDYFMLAQLTGFIDALQIAFARKPTVHRKILRALTNSINTGNRDQIKSRVLPHLRSNPKLAQAFRSLFPDERPPDSWYESGAETLNESFLISHRSCDEWELEGAAHDRRSIHHKDALDTMYLQGRVFLQHGRMLRSARVIYPYSKEPYRVHARRIAPDLCQLSPPDSDEELPSPKRSKATPKISTKRAKKQTKSPAKMAKDVNDNTNKCVNVRNNKKTKKVNSKKEDAVKTKKEKSSTKINQEATKSKVKLEANDKTDNNLITDSNSKKIETQIINATSTDANKSESQSIDLQNNSNSTDMKSWTRDEDKTMLQVLKGEAGSEQIFGRIKELLPHRTSTEIKERFCHVMVLLQQMAVAEVT